MVFNSNPHPLTHKKPSLTHSCGISRTIRLVAFVQVSYATLFTLSHNVRGTTRDNERRYAALVFACVLPVGQLVPFVMWLEGFGFQCFRRCAPEWKNAPHPTRSAPQPSILR